MTRTAYLKSKKKTALIIVKGVKLYKAVYNVQLYLLLDLRGGYTATGELPGLEKL